MIKQWNKKWKKLIKKLKWSWNNCHISTSNAVRIMNLEHFFLKSLACSRAKKHLQLCAIWWQCMMIEKMDGRNIYETLQNIISVSSHWFSLSSFWAFIWLSSKALIEDIRPISDGLSWSWAHFLLWCHIGAPILNIRFSRQNSVWWFLACLLQWLAISGVHRNHLNFQTLFP